MAQRKITAAVQDEAIRMVIEAGYTPAQAAMKMRLRPKEVAHWVEELRELRASPAAYSAYLQRELDRLNEKVRVTTQACIDLRAQLPPHLAELFPDRTLEQD